MLRRAFPIFNLLVITLAAYLGVDAFYQVAGVRLAVTPKASLVADKPVSNQADTKSSLIDYHAIIQRDLFKTAPPAEEPAQAIDVDALKATSLNIKLLGTVAGPPETAYAVILETAQKKQDLFRIKDFVAGAEVRQILRQMVVLRVNDHDEVLRMEEPDSSKRSGGLFGKAGSKGSGGSQTARKADELIRISRAKVMKSLKNVNQLMTQVRVRPHFEDGKPGGLALSRIRPSSIFREMGLQNGDVIQGVNDKNISSTEDVLALYKNLTGAENVTLQIKRGGEPTSIQYSFR